MDINSLVQKYIDEDKNWSIEVLLGWLQRKKGISSDVAEYALMEVLIEMDNGKQIPTHHEFDNYVLKIARERMNESERARKDYLINKLNETLANQKESLWDRIIKRKRVIRG